MQSKWNFIQCCRNFKMLKLGEGKNCIFLKIKHVSIYGPSTARHLSKRIESMNVCKDLFLNAHSILFIIVKKLKFTQYPWQINAWTNCSNPYNGLLLDDKKEQILRHKNMDDSKRKWCWVKAEMK